MSTENEKNRWSKRLERCMNDMPDDLMILVCTSSIDVVDRSAYEKSFVATNNFDQVANFSDYEYSFSGNFKAEGNESRI